MEKRMKAERDTDREKHGEKEIGIDRYAGIERGAMIEPEPRSVETMREGLFRERQIMTDTRRLRLSSEFK